MHLPGVDPNTMVERREAAQPNPEPGLLRLFGSPKQVRWAQDIRATRIAEAVAAGDQDLVRNMYGIWAARSWIDHRKLTAAQVGIILKASAKRPPPIPPAVPEAAHTP
jgi:hypothetical protein